MEKAKIVIIGAGIVGLSVAASLSLNNEGIVILERNSRIGQETSSHNSGVIHSGIHYPAGSLKARLCVRGNTLIQDFSKKYNIPYKRLGKVTVATDEDGIKELDRLLKTGQENGVVGLKMLDDQEVTEMEPNVNAEAALYSPTTGILEPEDLMQYFHSIMNKNGVMEALETVVAGLRKTSLGYVVNGISAGHTFSIQAETVINCGGLNADKVAAMVGLDIDKLGYRLYYYKGDYFRIVGKPPVRILVYPVPKGAGLGIHLTPDMSGSVRLGPNAYPVNKIDYITESSADEFREDVKSFLPLIAKREIYPDSSGIRPKLKGSESSFKDFIIKHEAGNGFSGLINLIGIESPGLTASPAIGEYVSGIYENEIKR